MNTQANEPDNTTAKQTPDGAPEQPTKSKSWMYWALGAVVLLILGILLFAPPTDSTETNDASPVVVVDSATQAELAAAQAELAAAQAELAAANQKQAIADSLEKVIATQDSLLVAANAALAATPAPANAKPAANAVAAGSLKPSKGKPITNDTDKTFTVLNSDSALIVNAPTGYKVIRKPR
jgi:hypothetical protein